MITKQYKYILVLLVSITLLAVGYNLLVYFDVEDQNPTYETIPEGPRIFGGKADKLKVEGLLQLESYANKDLSYVSGSIENDKIYYSVVVDLSLLSKSGIRLKNNLYEKYHRVKISNQYEHFMIPNDFKIYKIVEVLD